MTKQTTLENCPIGLFFSGDELCFKSQYRTDEGAIEAFIVSSGEFFWGGSVTPQEQREMPVLPMSWSVQVTPASEQGAAA